MNANDEALLNDLLDGRLDEGATRDLEARLAAETDLAAAWDELQRMRTLLRRPDPVQAPDAFLAGVHRRLAADDGGSWEERTARALLERPPRRDERPRWRLMALPLSAAALLLIGLVVADRLGSRTAVQLAKHGDEYAYDAKAVDAFEGGPPRSETARNDDRPATVERAAAPAPDRAAESRLGRGDARGGPRPAIPGLAGGGGSAPRLQPGGAVPTGLRTPSDSLRPDALEVPSGDDASATTVPTLVFALTTESIQNGTRSLASLLDERLEAGLDGAWRVVPSPATGPKAAARPMAASPSTLRLIPLEPTQLDPTAIEVAGRRVFDSMTLVLSPAQARRLGTFVRDQAPAPPVASNDEAEDGEEAAESASRERDSVPDSVSEEDAERARAKAKKEVRVRIFLVR